jgi:hypothetical protein
MTEKMDKYLNDLCRRLDDGSYANVDRALYAEILFEALYQCPEIVKAENGLELFKLAILVASEGYQSETTVSAKSLKNKQLAEHSISLWAKENGFQFEGES